jgi:ribosomal protein L16 Arg81 hydroxylase
VSDGERSLEERVAALEALTLQPATAEMTDEQVREFEKNFAQIVTQPWQPQILPSRPPLTQDEVRQLLRECVTVVKPGETLVIRGDRNWSPNQLREVQDWLDKAAEWRDLPFKIVVVPGEELGVAEPWRTEPRRYEYPVGGAGGHE